MALRKTAVVALVSLLVLSGCSGSDIARGTASAFAELFGKDIREGIRGNVDNSPIVQDGSKAWCVDEESGWIRPAPLEETCIAPETKFLRRVDAEARAQAIGGKYDNFRICLRSGSKTSMGLYALQLSSNQQCDPSGLEFTATGAAFKGLDKLQKQ